MAGRKTEPGRVLGERYRLESRLGAGGFGSVWRAHHLVLEAPVAVKLIDPEVAQDEGAVERFMREAKALASLRSPHVVQILDYGLDAGQPYIAMELLEGESLAHRIARLGRLSPEQTIRVVNHISRAIGRAHEAHIVHRDLKPENVFLVHNDDDEVAKVLDFGVAKIKEGRLGVKTSSTRTGALLGTPYYMSPEQALGNKEVDYRSDLWSLGVIAFEAITGKRPFFSDGLGDLVLQITVRPLPVPSEFAPVPSGFDAWFARAMSRDPAGRFASAREMSEALRAALEVAEDQERVAVVTVSAAGEEPQALLKALAAPPQEELEDSLDDGGEIGAAETVRALIAGPAGTAPAGARAEAGAKRGDPLAADQAVTVAQFGTSRSPTERGGPLPVLLGVAFGALTLGALLGLALFARGGETEVADRSHGAPRASVSQAKLAPPAKSVAIERTGAAPDGDQDAIEARETGGREQPATTSPDGSAAPEERDAGPRDDWFPRQVDGGWVRPDWARVEEPAPAPSAPPPPPEEPDAKDNPYR